MSNNHKVVRGDTLDFKVTVKEGATPMNLTGLLDAWMTAKSDITHTDANAVFVKRLGTGITVTNATGGEMKVKVAPADTNSLAPGLKLYYDLQIKTSASDIYTLATGTLTIIADVTRNTT